MSLVNIAILPLSNSIPIYPLYPSFPGINGQDNYSNVIQDWQSKLPYLYKAQYGDQILILLHSNLGTNPPQLFLCDKFKNIITGVNLNIQPFYKNLQTLANNNYTDPYSGEVFPLRTTMWNFAFSDLMISSPDTYYLKLINPSIGAAPAVSFFSEPISVNAVQWNTHIIQFSYNTNNFSKNVYINGWYNDYPDNVSQFFPVFSQRVEGYWLPASSKVVNIGYLQQLYQQLQIKTQQMQFWKFKPGELSLGIPWYLLQMITEALLADTVFIDGYKVILYNPGSSESLTDIWKVKDDDNMALIKAEVLLMTTYLAQSALIYPPPAIDGRLHADTYDSLHD